MPSNKLIILFIIQIWRENHKVPLLVGILFVRLLLKVHLFDCLIPPCLGVSLCNFGHRVISQTVVFYRNFALIGLQGHPSEWEKLYKPYPIPTIADFHNSEKKILPREEYTKGLRWRMHANCAIPASTDGPHWSFGICNILSTWRNPIRWILI